MPRSPSHSANGSELKQMLASCKTSSGKRQAVELLQGTKNSHLQYVLNPVITLLSFPSVIIHAHAVTVWQATINPFFDVDKVRKASNPGVKLQWSETQACIFDCGPNKMIFLKMTQKHFFALHQNYEFRYWLPYGLGSYRLPLNSMDIRITQL